MSNNFSPKSQSVVGHSRYAASLSFLRLLLSKWPYYILSICLVSMLLFLLLQHRPPVTRKYYLSLRSKADEGSRLSNVSLWGGDYYPPLSAFSALSGQALFGYLNATSSLHEAIKRSNAMVTCSYRKFFKNRDLYGHIPFDIQFVEPEPGNYVRCSAKQKSNGLQLSNFQIDDRKYPGTSFLPFDCLTDTPIGKLFLSKNMARLFVDKPYEDDFDVLYTDPEQETRILNAELEASSYDGLVGVSLKGNKPEMQMIGILNELIAVSVERMLADATTELERTKKHIEGILADPDKKLTSSMRNRLEEFSAEAEVSLAELRNCEPAEVLDYATPAVVESDTSLYFVFLFLVLAFVIPTLWIYYRMVLRNQLISLPEAPSTLSADYLGCLPRKKRKQNPQEWERMALMLWRKLEPLPQLRTVWVSPLSMGVDAAHAGERLAEALRKYGIEVCCLSSEWTDSQQMPDSENPGKPCLRLFWLPSCRESNELIARIRPEDYVVWISRMYHDRLEDMAIYAHALNLPAGRSAVLVLD